MAAMDMPIALCADFSVLYEDEGVLAVNKAAPLLTHPTGPKEEPTLWHGLRELLAYELATGGQVSLINRLDRETSGITLVAKTAEAARELGIAMQNRQMEKEYLALVFGSPAWESGHCGSPIRRMEEVLPTRVHVRQCCHPGGKPCATDFTVLRRVPAREGRPALALLSCRPHTGRMHQIRVHAAALGFPLVGDKIYGADERFYLDFMEKGWTHALESALLLPRQALHAHRLRFPWRGQLIAVEAPLPPDMAALLG